MPIIGTQQSPIKIVKNKTWKIDVPEGYLYPNYSGNELAGHFDLESKNFVFEQFEHFVLDGQPWGVRKLHFHDLAEHRLVNDTYPAGHRADYEAHLLHAMGTSPNDDPDGTGPKLVLGTLFHRDAGAERPGVAAHLSVQVWPRTSNG